MLMERYTLMEGFQQYILQKLRESFLAIETFFFFFFFFFNILKKKDNNYF